MKPFVIVGSREILYDPTIHANIAKCQVIEPLVFHTQPMLLQSMVLLHIPWIPPAIYLYCYPASAITFVIQIPLPLFIYTVLVQILSLASIF